MNKIYFTLILVFVLMVSTVFAGDEKILTNKNEYGGKTVENIINMGGIYKIVMYHDENGSRTRRDIYLDGENIWRAHKVIVYYDTTGTKLFEEHFDQNGEPVQDPMGWRYIGSHSDGDLYYRPRDIERLSGDKIRIRCKIKLSKKIKNKLAEEYDKQADDISYTEILYEIRSSTKKWTVISYTLYDKTGRLIENQTLKEDELEWDVISQGTGIDILYNIAHRQKW